MDTTGIVVIACLAIAFVCFFVYALHEAFVRLRRRLSRSPPELHIRLCGVLDLLLLSQRDRAHLS